LFLFFTIASEKQNVLTLLMILFGICLIMAVRMQLYDVSDIQYTCMNRHSA